MISVNERLGIVAQVAQIFGRVKHPRGMSELSARSRKGWQFVPFLCQMPRAAHAGPMHGKRCLASRRAPCGTPCHKGGAGVAARAAKIGPLAVVELVVDEDFVKSPPTDFLTDSIAPESIAARD